MAGATSLDPDAAAEWDGGAQKKTGEPGSAVLEEGASLAPAGAPGFFPADDGPTDPDPGPDGGQAFADPPAPPDFLDEPPPFQSSIDPAVEDDGFFPDDGPPEAFDEFFSQGSKAPRAGAPPEPPNARTAPPGAAKAQQGPVRPATAGLSGSSPPADSASPSTGDDGGAASGGNGFRRDEGNELMNRLREDEEVRRLEASLDGEFVIFEHMQHPQEGGVLPEGQLPLPGPADGLPEEGFEDDAFSYDGEEEEFGDGAGGLDDQDGFYDDDGDGGGYDDDGLQDD
jgi:hypothetical protein